MPGFFCSGDGKNLAKTFDRSCGFAWDHERSGGKSVESGTCVASTNIFGDIRA